MIGNTNGMNTCLFKCKVYLFISKNLNHLGAIMKSQPGFTSMDAESQIAETLKHAPGLVRRKAFVSIFLQ